jgi:hypothetical protein
MRKAIALLAALVALPSFGAVDTTTISGKVLTPSGDPATAGKVTCELSQAASASDGSGVQRVATRVSATIGATGAVSIAIAPNDTLTPAGTYYTCKFTVTTPASASWVEKWSVASAPDPVDLGSVSRLDVAPGTTTGVYVVALATCSGACPNGGVCIDKDDASTFYCYAGSWTRQDMPPCSPDPPTGPCADGRLCQATATGFAIYGCYAGAWAAVTGSGSSSVSVDGAAVGNPDFVDTADINFSSVPTGQITGTVQEDSVALTTDTTGDYVAGVTTDQGLLKTGTEAASVGLMDCAAGQVLKRDVGDTVWECGTDNTATAGTVSIDGAPNVPATGQVGIWTDTSEQGGDEELTYSTATNTLTVEDLTVTNAISGSITGNAASATLATGATALAANPTDCSANQYAHTIAASGNLTCSAISDTDVPDAITIGATGSVNWAALVSYPLSATCAAGQFVSKIDDAITCGTPAMSTATSLDADADGTANVTADADSVDFSLDGTGTVARVASDGSYLQVGTTADGSRGATFQDNTTHVTAPASGYTLLYSLGGEFFKKDNGDGTSYRIMLNSGNLAGDVTADATGNVTIADNAVQESDIDFDNTASTGQCATKSATSEKFTWAACGAGGGPTTDDAVLVGNGSTSDSKVIPDCDTGTLNYDTTTNAFSCGTDDTGGAGSTTSFDYDQDGTSESMVVSDGDGDTLNETGDPRLYWNWSYECDGDSVDITRFIDGSVNTVAITDADPQTTASAGSGVCEMVTGTSTGNRANLGTVRATDTTLQAHIGDKLVYFYARVKATSGGSVSAARHLFGGYRTSTNGNFTTKTDGIFFWCAPQDDVDNDTNPGDDDTDGTGSSHPDGDCADAGEDADDCKWWAVAMNNATDDASGKLAAATNTQATNTGVSCVDSTNWAVLEIKWDSASSQYDFYVNGTKYQDSSSTYFPSDSRKLFGWGAWTLLADGTNMPSARRYQIDYMQIVNRK